VHIISALTNICRHLLRKKDLRRIFKRIVPEVENTSFMTSTTMDELNQFEPHPDHAHQTTETSSNVPGTSCHHMTSLQVNAHDETSSFEPYATTTLRGFLSPLSLDKHCRINVFDERCHSNILDRDKSAMMTSRTKKLSVQNTQGQCNETIPHVRAGTIVDDTVISLDTVAPPVSALVKDNVTGCSGAGLSTSEVLRKHCKLVVETLGAAAECLDMEDASMMSNILVALGQIHGPHHVRVYHLPACHSLLLYDE